MSLPPLTVRRTFALTICLLLVRFSIGQISFDRGNVNLNGFSLNASTDLQFGPDFRLYVSERYGKIKILTLDRLGLANYQVTKMEVLDEVTLIPNHQDNGLPGGPSTRQVTSLVVEGSAEHPVLYVSSSDSRGGGGSNKGDVNLDTNSGIITRLTWVGNHRDDPEGYWESVDLVRGLPRSEENHSPNGMQFTQIGGRPFLLLSVGGFTNAGGPSNNFAYSTEYALAAAILAIDLEALETQWPPWFDNRVNRLVMYDLPTLDDPTRENITNADPSFPYPPSHPFYDQVIDLGDPFGGNDGLNQAKLLEDSPVTLFAPGFRNAYGLLVTEKGAVFATENGANGGWGGYPKHEGNPELVNNDYRPGEPGSSGYDSENEEPSVKNVDHLHRICSNIENYTFGSFYGGHPHPLRANPEGAGMFTRGSHTRDPGDLNNNSFLDDWFRTIPFDPKASGEAADPFKALPADWPPVEWANPVEADYRNPGEENPDGENDLVFATWLNNTNGLDEYTASNFDGTLRGNIFAGRSGGSLHRLILDTLTGDRVSLQQDYFSNLGGNPLGVACQGDEEAFPGTIWVATFNDALVVLEPNDFIDCTLPSDPAYDPEEDYDNDGFSNRDEVQNGTDPCNGASQPNDFDGDKLSDLLDPDDDDDGLTDETDPFQLGEPFSLPVANEFFSDNPVLKGYLGTGLTGMMNNGDPNPNYQAWLDDPGVAPRDIYGGAAGALTIYQNPGDATDQGGGQRKAFQYGVQVDQTTGVFTVLGRMLPPFHSHKPTEYQGFFLGDGFQDDYLRLVLSGDGLQPVIRLAGENDGRKLPGNAMPITLPQAVESISLGFRVDPKNGSVQPLYGVNVTQPAELTAMGTPIQAEGRLLQALQQSEIPLAVGVIGRADKADGFAATFDYLAVQGTEPRVAQPISDQIKSACDSSTLTLELDAYFADDNGVENLTYGLVANENPAFSARVTGSRLTLELPDPEAETEIVVQATDQEGHSVKDTFGVRVVRTFAPPGTPSAKVELLEGQGQIDASTFRKGAFALVNTSESQDIESISIDLTSALLPSMAFDPDGTAGDQIAKGFEVNVDGGAGPFSHSFSQPIGNGGYQVLTIEFGDFNPGERVTFSIDVDPVSIEGAEETGPGASGSVSGLELSGTTLRVRFNDNTEKVSTLFSDGSPAGSVAFLQTGLPGRPTLQVVGLNPPSRTSVGKHALVISGARPNSSIALLQVEGAYFAPDKPVRPPFPFEANSAIQYQRILNIRSDNSGSASVEVNLLRSSPSGGYNYFAVALQEGCAFGPMSEPQILYFAPDAEINNPPVWEPIPDFDVLAGEQLAIPFLVTDSEGDPLTLSATVTNTVTNQEIETERVSLTEDGKGSGTLTWNTLLEDVGNFRVRLSAFDGSNSSNISFLLAINSVDRTNGFNINSGSTSSYETGKGEIFLSDRYFAPPKSRAFSTSAEIFNSADDPLFRTERTGGKRNLPPLRYAIPVANGEYVVQLYFAELYHDRAGKRKFTVELEDRTVLLDYDVWSTAELLSGSGGGKNYALVESFPVTISDGQINLALFVGPGGIDNAKISAISVRRAGTQTNDPPLVTVPSEPIHREGDLVDLTIEAFDDPDQTLLYRASGLPPGLSINPSTGRIQGTVSANAASNSPYLVRIGVRDDGSPSLHRIFSFPWTIQPKSGNLPPVLSSVDDQTVAAGNTLNLSFSASDPDGDLINLLFSLVDTDNKVLDPETYSFVDTGNGMATFSWTPSRGEEGVYTAKLTAMDGMASTEALFTVKVIPPEENNPPAIGPIADQMLRVGEQLSLFFEALDPENDPITLRLQLAEAFTGELVPEEKYAFQDLGNGRGSFAWIPSETQVGEYLVTLTASDGQATGTMGFGVEVLDAPDSEAALCLNAGSQGTYTATDGQVFQPDAYFSKSRTTTYAATDILHSTDAELYRDERYAKDFSYAIPLQANGEYIVDLYFAELFHQRAGRRVFSVRLEGEQVLTDYDIWSEANLVNNGLGGTNIAVTESFAVTVSDLVLDLRLFLGNNGKDNAKLSAICIRPAVESGNLPPVVGPIADRSLVEGDLLVVPGILVEDPDGDALSVSIEVPGVDPSAYSLEEQADGTYTFTWPTGTGDRGTYQATVSASDGLLTARSAFTIEVSSGSAPGDALCLNAGSDGTYTAADGRVFQPDAFFTKSRRSGYGGADIPNSPDDVIYRTERYGNAFFYRIPLPANGDYTVDLHFAEIFHDRSGERVFSVELEGEEVLSGYDIWSTANAANGGEGGSHFALVESFPVTVSDMQLDLRFFLGPNGADKAKVSAICVRPAERTNQAPVVESIANQTVVAGGNLTVSEIRAMDPDGDPIRVFIDIPRADPSSYTFAAATEGNYILYWPTDQLDEGSYEATVTATDGILSATSSFSIDVLAPVDEPRPGLCLDAGGLTDYRAPNGDRFLADDYFITPRSRTFQKAASIRNTDADPMFQTERYGGSNNSNPPFRYAIPVGNGEYLVELHFVELVKKGPGQRRFNVDLEGQTVLNGYDTWAEASEAGGGDGRFYALVESFTTQVTDGVMDIAFYLPPDGLDNAHVAGICLRPASLNIKQNAVGLMASGPREGNNDRDADVVSRPEGPDQLLENSSRVLPLEPGLSLRNAPNPFYDWTVLEIFMPDAGEARLDFFSLDGRLLHSKQTDLVRGWNRVRLSRQDLGGASGVILARLSNAESVFTRRMIMH